MSRIALVSAMHEELAAVLARMPDEQKTVVAGREFWVGHWHGHDVVAVLSRIGKVAAATTATTLIERFGVSRIVFTGVPLAAVRTISDRADDAAHVDFPRFIQSIASRYSVAVLDRLLSTLPA